MKAIIAVPATLALVYRAWSHKSLTPAGIVAAVFTAIAHAIHPWNLPFALLVVFFLAGSRVTKVKQDVKATLTMSSKGMSGGEGARTHIQVFANSLVASILTLLHAYQLRQRAALLLQNPAATAAVKPMCFSWPGDLLVVGIVANYAAVAADTFSSELGILSRSTPRLITSPTLRRVPPGTNGGVTVLGLGAGLLGSMIVVATAMLFVPFCGAATAGKLGGGTEAQGWAALSRRTALMWGLALWGALGSVLDSILGGLLQRSVRDARSGKIVEGEGGVSVLLLHDRKNLKRRHVKAGLLGGEAAGKEVPSGSEAAVSEASSREGSPEKKNGAKSARYDAKDKHRTVSFGDEKPTRVVESGLNVLDNNQVNFLMAVIMSLGAMVGAGWYWGVPLSSILEA